MEAPSRHTPRQEEILKTLDPELRYEFHREESRSINAWFDYVQSRVDYAISEMSLKHAELAGRK